MELINTSTPWRKASKTSTLRAQSYYTILGYKFLTYCYSVLVVCHTHPLHLPSLQLETLL